MRAFIAHAHFSRIKNNKEYVISTCCIQCLAMVGEEAMPDIVLHGFLSFVRCGSAG